MGQPLINGRSYAWADISFNIGGYVPVGVTAINYDDDEIIEDNYGQGNMPVSRGYGNYKAGASITLHAEEVEAITAKAPNGRLKDLGIFDVTVQYMVGAAITTHVLKNCQFSKNSRGVNQGDPKIEVELPLNPSHILWKK
jgi:hypothetical protein